MIINDDKIKTKSGATFSLHYRVLNKDTYSGFIRNVEWPRNCAISIPKTVGNAKFMSIVNLVIDNEDKFTEYNTLGRPRYYDILGNGIEGLAEQNKIHQIRETNPEFKTYKNSKRMWYYKTIGGNFNMKSIKINHMRIVDSVSFKELMPFVKNEDVKTLLAELGREKFEFEVDFLNFCDKLIDATEDTLLRAYNDYTKSLFGTHTSLMRHKKDGSESFTYYVYVSADASPATKALQKTAGKIGIPADANVKVVELKLFPEEAISTAIDDKTRHDRVQAMRNYFQQKKAEQKAAKKAARQASKN